MARGGSGRRHEYSRHTKHLLWVMSELYRHGYILTPVPDETRLLHEYERIYGEVDEMIRTWRYEALNRNPAYHVWVEFSSTSPGGAEWILVWRPADQEQERHNPFPVVGYFYWLQRASLPPSLAFFPMRSGIPHAHPFGARDLSKLTAFDVRDGSGWEPQRLVTELDLAHVNLARIRDELGLDLNRCDIGVDSDSGQFPDTIWVRRK